MTRAAEWQGRVGGAWANEWRRTDRAFAGIGAALGDAIDAVAPHEGGALDIGCGAGATTQLLATMRPGISVVGADLSESLLAVARDRCADLANTSFRHGDAVAVAGHRAPLDLLVSRHGVMFFDDPSSGFAALRAAAAPGAPLVFSCFRSREQNDWSVVTSHAIGAAVPPATGYAPGPYGLADHDFSEALLASTGWRDAHAIPLDVPYILGAGDDPVADALSFLGRIGSTAPVLTGTSPEERSRLEDRLRDVLAPHVSDGRITFSAAIWIWTATAG